MIELDFLGFFDVVNHCWRYNELSHYQSNDDSSCPGKSQEPLNMDCNIRLLYDKGHFISTVLRGIVAATFRNGIFHLLTEAWPKSDRDAVFGQLIVRACRIDL